MKRLLTLLLTAVLMVTVIVCVAPKALAATTVTVTDSAGINMREGPGTSYNKVIGVPANTVLTVLEIKSADGYTWGKVTYDGKTGWIALEFTNYDPSQNQPNPPPVTTGKWVQESGKWYYYIDGVKQTGWKMVGSTWYYMDENGVMQTGWKLIGGKWYYLQSSGAMQTGWLKEGGSTYYFDSNGIMQTGWTSIGGYQYYFNTDGSMYTGWLEYNSKWYYLKANGAMAVGKAMIDGKPNKFDKNGVWLGLAKYMTSDACITILKQEEGFSSKPYWDVSQWTVGYGTRCPDDKVEYYKQYGISEAEAELLLRDYIMNTEDAIEAFFNRYNLEMTASQFDALVLFSYNCGYGWTTETDGTFHNAIKNGATGSELLRAFGLWSSAGGDILDVLIRRRQSEVNMYLNGVYSQEPPDNYCHVRYDVNGGNKVYRVQCYDSNETPAPSEIPTHETMYFAGWYTAKTGGTKVTKLTKAHDGTTLYARWSETQINPDPGNDNGSTGKNVVTVIGDSLNVRKGPGTEYDKVTQLTRGAQVAILELKTVGNYVWGRYTDGWIRLDYTDYNPNTFELPGGWVKDGDVYYYLQNGKKVTGWKLIDGAWYYFKSNGVMHTGWLQDGKDWYYLQSSGKMQKGWLLLGDTWYYMNSSGVMQTGWLKDGGNWYYLQSSGAMVQGLQKIDNKTYYFNAGGAMQTGVVELEGKKYYFGTDGTMQTGWQEIDGKRYYFKTDGVMAKGWLLLGNTWYYLNADGTMHTGWLDLGPTRYYLGADGVMATGIQTIDGQVHQFNSSGAWIGQVQEPQKNGWVQENGKWYYFSNGVMKTGWVSVGGIWYYMNSSGIMQTGWLKDGGNWYYLQSSGAMKTGWLKLGNTWYYLKSSGEMVTGTYKIGPVTYKFDSNGVWIG